MKKKTSPVKVPIEDHFSIERRRRWLVGVMVVIKYRERLLMPYRLLFSSTRLEELDQYVKQVQVIVKSDGWKGLLTPAESLRILES